MGEYATRTDGTEIKIGTCEDMYYLRYDQRNLVWPKHGNVNPQRDVDGIRFRFPWPDEDTIAPGDFEDFDRGLVVWGATLPEDMDHYSVQFRADNGYLVSLPCPEGPSQHGFTIHRNGYGGAVRLVQQRVWEGKLVAVAECKGCRARYRMPTLDDARLLLDGIEAMAANKERDYQRSTLDGGQPTLGDLDIANNYREIARRIVAGYELTV